jgi:NADPH-dependent dioxygenase
MACAQEGRGADALREQLRDTRWTLLVAEGGRDRLPLRTSLRAADHCSGWLSVRTLCALRSRAVPGVLTDPDGALRAALALPPGGWALIRPDGYLAARGHRLTPRALETAMRPLCLRPALQSVPSDAHADAERIARGSGAAGAA